MKKWIISLSALLVVTLICVSLLPMNAQAAVPSGKCGDNLTWKYESLILTISGTGPMYNYSEENKAPWTQIEKNIHSWTIEEGVTSIGDYAFAHKPMASTGSVLLPTSITSIGSNAFANWSLANLYFKGDAPSFAEDAFENAGITVHTVNWPESVKKQYSSRKLTWKEVELRLAANHSNVAVPLNGTLKKEDVEILYMYTVEKDYTPREFSVSAYDNTTYGQKDVTITVDGSTFDYTFFISDGKNHLDLLDVTFDKMPYYTGKYMWIEPTITLGTLRLVRGQDYDLETERTTKGILFIKVIGKGLLEGFEKTFYAPIVKSDLSNADINPRDEIFKAEPMTTLLSVRVDAQLSKEEYTAVYENNVNVGNATVRVIGNDYYYGEAVSSFKIELSEGNYAMTGNYLGKADGELSEDYYIEESMCYPGPKNFWIKGVGIHIFACQLYEYQEDTAVLIADYVSGVGDWSDNQFQYDFSYVYEEAADVGGRSFALIYSWVDENLDVYGGIRILHVPSKVRKATSVTLQQVEKDGDFRQDYFTLVGDDGVVDSVAWTSSDSTVAAVKNGTVTFYKPGKATITARYGNITKTHEMTVATLDLTEGFIFDYKNGKANVIWDNRILEENVDYTLSVEQRDVGTVVTATGKGLFAGQLEKVFNGINSLANPHTHSYTDSKDQFCNGCGCNRDYQLTMPGDITANGSVNNEDVAYLLWHTLFAEDYPLTVNGDLTSDGAVNNDDVVLLLWHTLFPKDYPL